MDVLLWLDSDAARYQALALAFVFGLCAIVLAGAFVPRANARLSTRVGTIVFLAFALLVLFAARWPTLFVREPLNQDEAQALAEAITALHDPIPWLGFDGNTVGPLNVYVLTLPAIFGLHLSFLTTRVVAILLEFGAIAALYVSAEICFDASVARVAVVPPILFWTLSIQDHFLHYSGEHLSIFLGMAAVAFVCFAWRSRYDARWIYALGVAGGMMPFAKIQSVPLDAVTMAIGAASVLGAVALSPRAKLARLAWLALGLLTAPAIIMLVCAVGGSLYDFWISYIQSSLAYILYENMPLSFVTQTPEFGPLFDALVAIVLLGVAALALGWSRVGVAPRNAFLAALAILAAAVDTIYAPKRGSLNYLQFGVVPAAGAAAAALGVALVAFARGADAGVKRGAAALVFVVACLVATSAFARPQYPYVGALHDYLSGPPDDVTALLREYVHPGDRLAIWGWRPKYFVYTYALMGTRDAISHYQLDPNYNPYLDYFRARYIADMEKNKPVAFLDAGPDSFDFSGGGADGHEVFPGLAALIARDYHLVGTTANKTRLYVRN